MAPNNMGLAQGPGQGGCMPRGGAGAIDGAPSNITVMFLSHTSVHVNWSTNMENVEKYDVTYKPTDASFKVVIVVAGNSESVVLDQLLPDTQYQMWVQAFRAGRRFRSRQIVFRTLVDPDAPPVTGVPPLGAARGSPGVGAASGPPGGSGAPSGAPSGPASPSKSNKALVIPPNPPVPQDFIQVWSTSVGRVPDLCSPQVRGVEVGIVLLVLVVWVGAIVLFFNRWGKIRMLLPYQPDYKEQLKVPGTGACGGGGGAPCAGQHASSCSQGCCVLEQCFSSYASPRPEPRDCNCRFALLHRADT
ncbi:Collagen alpha-1(XIV) chain [Frankliniella fusca]|uniref:Collagen alpha-1(XIV) chain n=1 Tax=Frankliniella fusca TaxID=407009 RepID=A0AAE1LQ77_9NEOP|nr:Collagen alpha-1(XIV) chain [Frankliniella fusca]